MVAYDIGIIPLIKLLKEKFPDVTKPWYADNTGALGMFAKIKLYFNFLKRFRPGRGYLPKPS